MQLSFNVHVETAEVELSPSSQRMIDEQSPVWRMDVIKDAIAILMYQYELAKIDLRSNRI